MDNRRNAAVDHIGKRLQIDIGEQGRKGFMVLNACVLHVIIRALSIRQTSVHSGGGCSRIFARICGALGFVVIASRAVFASALRLATGAGSFGQASVIWPCSPQN